MILKEIEQLGTLHHIIKCKYKGTPEEIANKLSVSRSCLYAYIDKLSMMGAKIIYNRSLCCFQYVNDFSFKITLETNEMKKIIGGRNYFENNFFRPEKMDGKLFNL